MQARGRAIYILDIAWHRHFCLSMVSVSLTILTVVRLCVCVPCSCAFTLGCSQFMSRLGLALYLLVQWMDAGARCMRISKCQSKPEDVCC